MLEHNLSSPRKDPGGVSLKVHEHETLEGYSEIELVGKYAAVSYLIEPLLLLTLERIFILVRQNKALQ